MKFSLKKQSFYADDVNYGTSLPDDVVEITDEQYQQFYNGLNSGCVIYDASGNLKVSAARPNQYASWDSTAQAWIMTDAATAQQAADEKAALTATASSEFSRATAQIGVLSDKIDLSDYSTGETSDTVTADLTSWKTYRIACNSVIKGTATVLPSAPDA